MALVLGKRARMTFLVISMLVNISMIKSMAKVNFNGNQEIFTKEIGKEVYKMEEQQ